MLYDKKKRSSVRCNFKNKSNHNVCSVGNNCPCRHRLSKLKKRENIKFFGKENPFADHNYLNYV